MPSHTAKEKAKRKRKVASNGTKKPKANGLGGIPLKTTRKKEAKKKARKAMA